MMDARDLELATLKKIKQTAAAAIRNFSGGTAAVKDPLNALALCGLMLIEVFCDETIKETIAAEERTRAAEAGAKPNG